MKKLLLTATAVTTAAFFVTPANAQVVSLNFEGIADTLDGNFPMVQEFYNGGTSSDGTTGINYGVEFSDNALAICMNTLTRTCSNTSRGGLGDPNSQNEGLFFLTGTETFLNYAAGFDTGFSFNYVSTSFSGDVSVYDGLNGAGNLLATLNLSPNAGTCAGFSAAFCPFSATGVNFTGTAMSISFAGVADQIVFDDITFGSAVPGGVPEPATWAFMIFGFGAIGGAMRSRRKTKLNVSYA